MLGVGMVRVELKYCEGCGGLLLRRVGTDATYCAKCGERLRELAPSRQVKRVGRPPKVQPVVMTAAELRRQRMEEAEARVRQVLGGDPVREIEAVAETAAGEFGRAEATAMEDEFEERMEFAGVAEIAELTAVKKPSMRVRFELGLELPTIADGRMA